MRRKVSTWGSGGRLSAFAPMSVSLFVFAYLEYTMTFFNDCMRAYKILYIKSINLCMCVFLCFIVADASFVCLCAKGRMHAKQ